MISYLFVDCSELPVPCGIIQEGPVIKPVIIRTVTLHVYTWCQHSHFVPVDSIAPEKMFHLLCNLKNQNNEFKSKTVHRKRFISYIKLVAAIMATVKNMY